MTKLHVLLLGNLGEDFDAGLLAGCTSLQVFHAGFVDVQRVSVLGSLPALRELDLTGCDQLRSLAPLKGAPSLERLDVGFIDELRSVDDAVGLPALRELHLAGTVVRDISPLAACKLLETLDCSRTPVTSLAALGKLPKLRRVLANGTKVTALPADPSSALERLELLSAPAAREDVDAFRAAHPACTVLFGWGDALLPALRSADRVRVRSGGTCHRRLDQERVLIEETDAKRIGWLLDSVHIRDDRSGGHCMCCGNPTFEFFRGGERVATVGFHHGQGLRWDDGPWPGDAALEPASAARIQAWLAAYGIRLEGSGSKVALPDVPDAPEPGSWAQGWISVTGTVTDTTGAPLADARVEFEHNGALFAAETDADGKFTLRTPAGLNGGLQIGHALVRGRYREAVDDIAELAGTTISMKGEPAGAVRVRFTGAAADEPLGVVAYLCREGEQGTPCEFVQAGPWTAPGLTGGRWSLHVLPMHTEWQPQARLVTVEVGKIAEVAIALEPSQPITGKVTDAAGAPLSGVGAMVRYAWPPAASGTVFHTDRLRVRGPLEDLGGVAFSMGRGRVSLSWKSPTGRREFTLMAGYVVVAVQTGDDGRFRLDGLAAQPHQFMAASRGAGVLFRGTVTPGGDPLEIVRDQ